MSSIYFQGNSLHHGCNSQRIETTFASIKRVLIKYVMVDSYNGLLYSGKKRDKRGKEWNQPLK